MELFNKFEQIGEKKMATEILRVVYTWDGNNDSPIIDEIRKLCQKKTDERWL